MFTKCFEVRDEGTCIPVLGVKFAPASDRERLILRRGGFGDTSETQSQYLLLVDLNESVSQTDPYKWGRGRTLQEAHLFIMKNFEFLTSQDVIDIQYILRETPVPKKTSL